MKKTIRTVLTAAMFASANMTAIPGSAAGETNHQANEPTTSEVLTEMTDSRKPMPLYGPPEVLRTLTTSPLETLTTTTTTFMHTLYGPPWMFTTTTLPESTTTENMTTTTYPQVLYGGPLFFSEMMGDVNLDRQIDSFDAIALRRMLVTGKAQNFEASNYGDINRDGKVNISDLLLLQRFLLGQLKTLNEGNKQFMDWARDKEIEKITGTTVYNDNNTTTTTVYDPRNDIIVTLYGVAPIRDVLSDIRSDIESGIDAVAENNTPSQEK